MTERWQRDLSELSRVGPAPDLSQRVGWNRPSVPGRPPGSRGRKTLAIVVSVAVFAAGGYGIWRAFGRLDGAPVPGTSERSAVYRDPRFGWTITYPEGFRVGHFQGGPMFENDGARFTNFAPNLAITRPGSPPMGWLTAFPARGVALQVWFGERIPGQAAASDSALPLSLARLSEIGPYVGGNEPSPVYLSFQADAIHFAVAAWVGPKATPSDRRAIASMVASIRFPTLRAGTYWQERYYVIGPAGRYPAGSVTPFDVPARSGQTSYAYYLVHFGSHFDVLPQVFSTSRSTSSCRVVHVGAGFACEGPLLRWDLSGRLTGATGPANISPAPHDLACRHAVITQSGILVFGPFVGPSDSIGNLCSSR